ncbi:MAG: PAS domain-containing sensor histidine kinase [Bryobacteraceae bacterium]|jgi:PAS domain S-box-containing protein
MAREKMADLLERTRDLKRQLDEAEGTLRASRNGEADAVAVSGVCTLKDEAYRLMVESMAEGALTLTRNGLILFSNERFASMLGMPLDRVIGSSMHDFVAAEDALLLRPLLDGRVRTQAEVRLKRGSAGLAPALLSADTLLIEATECVCLIVTDLSDLRRAEEELNVSRQMLQLVLDYIPQRVFWKDREGRYLGCNKAFASDAGVPTAPNIVGKTVYDFSHWRDAADLYAAEDRQVMESGVAKIGYEEPVVGADGGRRWTRSSKVPLPGSIGGVIGILGTYEDITESKRAEEKLQRYSVELHGINEELKRFTQIVSHDLRAPLVNLKGFSAELRCSIDTLHKSEQALLANLPAPERAAVAQALQETIPEALGFIESSATSMDHLTAALLGLARAGRREFHTEELNAGALLQGTLRTLAHQIQSGNIDVKVGLLPIIASDRSAIEQIFGNLLDNAIKYLDPERPGRIEVSAEETADATVLHVRDNGRGIAEEDMDKVFQPFRRAGIQDVPGEGMGLAFVRMLLHRLGGRIECHSQLGVGTTFSFMLPKVR